MGYGSPYLYMWCYFKRKKTAEFRTLIGLEAVLVAIGWATEKASGL